MPNLMIKNAFGTWKAYVSNSPIEYSFSGATAQEQFVQVQVLQDAMSQGAPTVTQQIGNILRIQPGDEASVVQQLYQTSTELYFEGDLVFESLGDSTLLADIVEAGEALAAFV